MPQKKQVLLQASKSKASVQSVPRSYRKRACSTVQRKSAGMCCGRALASSVMVSLVGMKMAREADGIALQVAKKACKCVAIEPHCKTGCKCSPKSCNTSGPWSAPTIWPHSKGWSESFASGPTGPQIECIVWNSIGNAVSISSCCGSPTKMDSNCPLQQADCQVLNTVEGIVEASGSYCKQRPWLMWLRRPSIVWKSMWQ